MSYMRYLTLATLRCLNPNLDIRLYRPSGFAGLREIAWKSGESQDFDYCGPDYTPRLADLALDEREWVVPDEVRRLKGVTPASLSDFFRWDLLRRHGGWYFDMDILFLRPLSDVPAEFHIADVLIPFSTKHWCLYNSVLASQAGSPFFDECYHKALRQFNPDVYMSVATPVFCPYEKTKRFWQTVQADYPNERILPLPSSVFHGVECDDIHTLYEIPAHRLDKSPVGIHWFAGKGVS